MWGKWRVGLDERLYNYEECGRIWRRVSPELEPYPLSSGGEENLPGAQVNPCCMGTEAAESTEVLQGFVRVERCTKQRFSRLAAQSRDAAQRGCFAEFAQLAERRMKKLLSALYLITGETYRGELTCAVSQRGSWCEMLRALYHDAACSGFNYERASQETVDNCLSAMLASFAQEEYRRAGKILDLLAKSL